MSIRKLAQTIDGQEVAGFLIFLHDTKGFLKKKYKMDF